jgi:hypothetical protein
VEDCRLKYRDVVDATDGRYERRDFNRMIYVGRLVISLSPLVAMLERGEAERLEEGCGRQWVGGLVGWWVGI